MLNWLRKMWIMLAIIIIALVICGPLAQLIASTLGSGFAQPALIIDNLSAICLILMVCDFILDNREHCGFFPTLNLDAAIDVAINGDEDETGKKRRNPIAAALIFLGVIALLITILVLAIPSAHASTLDNARPYLPILSESLDKGWPAAPLRHIPAGQVEQESSWKERATLKTSRELGRGLVQMTIAYDKSGKERFNIYRDAVRNKLLKEWDWRRDPYNVRYQLTFLVLQDRANFDQVRPYFANDGEAWKGALVCYNAGAGRWLQRLKNARRMGLPTNIWDGGLDRAYGKGEAALLYGRPLYVAVNEYPKVIFGRAEKYRGRV